MTRGGSGAAGSRDPVGPSQSPSQSWRGGNESEEDVAGTSTQMMLQLGGEGGDRPRLTHYRNTSDLRETFKNRKTILPTHNLAEEDFGFS